MGETFVHMLWGQCMFRCEYTGVRAHKCISICLCLWDVCVSVTEEASGHRLGAGHWLLPQTERKAVVTLWTVLFTSVPL